MRICITEISDLKKHIEAAKKSDIYSKLYF